MASCEGVARFRVSPRPTLVSDPTSPPPATIGNTVEGAFTTVLNAPGESTPIPPNSDSLDLVAGTPRIDVNKGPENTTLAPR